MEIQQIGSHNLLIYLSGEDLHSSPQELETDEAADILRVALGDKRRDEWQNVYLELFVGRDCLLLFARAYSGVPRFFAFDEIEPLISAAKVSPPDTISFLTYSGGEYCLVVYPWTPELPLGALLEFGEERERSPGYALHLTEHGTVLLGPSALFDLQSIF